MGVMANEPSMEDILSSIKRIIADGSDRSAVTARTPRRRAAREEDEALESSFPADEPDSAILELTEMADDGDAADAPMQVADDASPTAMGDVEEEAAARIASSPSASTGHMASIPGGQILSDVSAQAARQSLSQLSSLLIRPQEGEPNTLEGLVRDMLRPMLKDWLEANLPELVESLVKKEIDRIVGRLG